MTDAQEAQAAAVTAPPSQREKLIEQLAKEQTIEIVQLRGLLNDAMSELGRCRDAAEASRRRVYEALETADKYRPVFMARMTGMKP